MKSGSLASQRGGGYVLLTGGSSLCGADWPLKSGSMASERWWFCAFDGRQ
jgi:hypothetical protein